MIQGRQIMSNRQAAAVISGQRHIGLMNIWNAIALLQACKLPTLSTILFFL
jgi:hypothetical protein